MARNTLTRFIGAGPKSEIKRAKNFCLIQTTTAISDVITEQHLLTTSPFSHLRVLHPKESSRIVSFRSPIRTVQILLNRFPHSTSPLLGILTSAIENIVHFSIYQQATWFQHSPKHCSISQQLRAQRLPSVTPRWDTMSCFQR